MLTFSDKKHRGGSIRATILPWASILTKAHRASVSIMAKGCIVAWLLSLRFSLPYYIHVDAIIMQYVSHLDKKGVLQQEYSQPPILPSPHFRWVVNGPGFHHVGF